MKTRKFRKKRCTVILLFAAFSIFVIFISSYHHTHRLKRLKEVRLNKSLLRKQQQSAWISSSPAVQKQDFKKREDEVVILFWTKYFGDDFKMDPSWISTNYTYAKCFEKCRVVVDKIDLATSDAVVFHSRDMRKNEMPLAHPTDQLWIYLQQESPAYTGEDLTEYENVFNWTMTYRHDSDIYHPYFLTLPLNLSEKSINNNKVALTSYQNPKFLQQKTKLVAWVVSNCHTKAKRENYVEQLESYIPIDIYGSCGDYPCRRSGEGCLPEIAHQYKFYLSFENSLCTEYITEKFSNALQYNLVPIVYGGGDYSSVAPPGSYINVHDFATPKALAEYLLLLHRNPKLYLQYFQWKTKYHVTIGDGWCSLCRKVAEYKLNHVSKIYENLSYWWYYQYMPPASMGEEMFENNKGPLPTCHDVSEDLSDNWNVVSFVKGLKYVKRWFYREMLG